MHEHVGLAETPPGSEHGWEGRQGEIQRLHSRCFFLSVRKWSDLPTKEMAGLNAVFKADVQCWGQTHISSVCPCSELTGRIGPKVTQLCQLCPNELTSPHLPSLVFSCAYFILCHVAELQLWGFLEIIRVKLLLLYLPCVSLSAEQHFISGDYYWQNIFNNCNRLEVCWRTINWCLLSPCYLPLSIHSLTQLKVSYAPVCCYLSILLPALFV